MTNIPLYERFSLLDIPAYGLAEASRYLHIAPAILRSWVFGRPYPRQTGQAYFEPLLQLSDPDIRRLSFANLIEAHVLRALRTEHGVSLRDVREALDIAQRHYGIDHLFLDSALRTHAGELFLKKYGELVHLDRAGQFALEAIFDRYLKRVDWQEELPVRLYPYLDDAEKHVAIDPTIAFGRPVIISKAISTSVIVDRYDAGESLEFIAADYDLTPAEVKTAILYERAA